LNNIPFSVEALLAKYKSEAKKAGGVYVESAGERWIVKRELR
jgi:hypothetical protein